MFRKKRSFGSQKHVNLGRIKGSKPPPYVIIRPVLFFLNVCLTHLFMQRHDRMFILSMEYL